MSALDKSTRRKIFYGMVLLFAVVAPVALLYSRGYVFDRERRGLVVTGGIFVKTVQSGARVFVDSEFSKETSFISHGALITNLIPRRYTVRVEKEGYQPWIKAVRVANEEVLEFRNVLLPPAAIRSQPFFSRSAGKRVFWLDGRRALALESGDPVKGVTLSLIHADTGAVIGQLNGVARWQWDAHSGSFIIGRNAAGRARWYRATFSSSGIQEEPIVFRGLPEGFSADRVIPHPVRAGEVYFSAGGALFLQGRATVPLAIAEQVHAYSVSGEHLYFISKNGFFAESDLIGGNTKLLGRKGLFLDEKAPAVITISQAGDVALLDAANGLFLYRPERSAELELVASKVLGIDFSASGDRLLFWDERHLGVYWLRDNPFQPFDLAGTKKQIFSSDDPIRQAYLNEKGTHIFYAVDGALRMVEVDDRANANNYDLLEAAVSSFVMDRRNLTLYWLENPRTLYRALFQPKPGA